MSTAIAALALDGAKKIHQLTVQEFEKILKQKGPDTEISFPGTGYCFPLAYALLGAEVRVLGDISPVLEAARKILPTAPPDKSAWKDPLGDLAAAGHATLLAGEAMVGLRYLTGEEPREGCQGFIIDEMLRTLGIQLVDGRIAGFAALLGAAPDSATAVEIVRGFQKKNILVFVGGESGGTSIIDQLKEEKVKLGWDNYLVPYGRDTFSAIFVLNWATRVPLTYGGLKKGEREDIIRYCRERVPALVVALGEIDEYKVAAAAGAISLGFPVITDNEVPQLLEPGLCLHEALVAEPDYEQIVARSIQTRGIKVRVKEIPIPVPYAAAFEGERVRKADMRVQFGGKYSTAFEYLKMDDLDRVEDGKIEVIGDNLDSIEEGGHLPLGIVVTVAGRNAQKEFESILERHLHSFINEAMGVMHVGQRNIIWLRINREAYQSGFRLSHLGEIIVARLHNDFGAIVDKVQVQIFTGEDEVARGIEEARKSYEARDERMAGMTDESVETFYSCTLCQSFAPNHVCIISPERLGLCGAYSWLDGKASHEITPTGPNQPVEKGRVIDREIGQWEGINEFVYEASHRSLERFSIYSMMIDPMTSCGCFECILAIIPEANGVMVVNREHAGMTPCGMDFITLAGMVGGGVQTPGFLGIGRLYVTSHKFISGDGGLKRLVWLTRELKEQLKKRLIKRGEEIGIPDFYDMIADENIAVDSAALLEFLEKKNHPALSMEPMF
ncbi:MAG: acetyl-CoA decarbonylase/synthase complex subunit alpha/beta [Candidatus Euphemobacter frigidus]|nr:acetyl-CoA decarbonylase/synthase complex subunit alpha/beta [Candidatus Euphemobacter frigidus]MDP8276514.1 acetyl-CoA decarbonylase/synthase complex subunit alpha/beta [Candidatus Euphemobacter frigidus]